MVYHRELFWGSFCPTNFSFNAWLDKKWYITGNRFGGAHYVLLTYCEVRTERDMRCPTGNCIGAHFVKSIVFQGLARSRRPVRPRLRLELPARGEQAAGVAGSGATSQPPPGRHPGALFGRDRQNGHLYRDRHDP